MAAPYIAFVSSLKNNENIIEYNEKQVHMQLLKVEMILRFYNSQIYTDHAIFFI